MRYELVILRPGGDVDTDHLESDAPLDLGQPITLTDDALVYAIARVDRPTVIALVCHPEPGRRIVFDVAKHLYPLAKDAAVELAQDFSAESRTLGREHDRTSAANSRTHARALRTAAKAIERALVETPHWPPLELTEPQLDCVHDTLMHWPSDATASDEAMRLYRALHTRPYH